MRKYYHLELIQRNFIEYGCHTNLRAPVRGIITHSSPHVAQVTAEKLEDVILQHELHLVLIYFFLCGERKKEILSSFTKKSKTLNIQGECCKVFSISRSGLMLSRNHNPPYSVSTIVSTISNRLY